MDKDECTLYQWQQDHQRCAIVVDHSSRFKGI